MLSNFYPIYAWKDHYLLFKTFLQYLKAFLKLFSLNGLSDCASAKSLKSPMTITLAYVLLGFLANILFIC